jgi:hypothetical protein
MNQPQTQTNEVARLRELLAQCAESLEEKKRTTLITRGERRRLNRIKEALAPAPEEPVSEAEAKAIDDYMLGCDPNEEATSYEEPAPEWRELGHDEEIHTGDQVQAKHHDRLHGVWLNVFPYEVGAMPIDHEAFRYRTRRPLPKREGEQPYCSRCKYNHAFPCEGSLAGVPLEDELDYLTKEASRAADIHNHVLIVDCLRYLRDEIEALKDKTK